MIFGKRVQVQVKETGQENREAELIAVVGMAVRFPAARDVRELWRNLRDGVEPITFLSHQDLLASGVDPELLCHPSFVKRRDQRPRHSPQLKATEDSLAHPSFRTPATLD